jgi:hypothetical protein
MAPNTRRVELILSDPHAILPLYKQTKDKQMMYPKDTLSEMITANGFDVTPALIELLNKAYELGVEDTY